MITNNPELFLSSGLLLPDHPSEVSSAVALTPDLAATTSFYILHLRLKIQIKRDFVWIFKSNVLVVTMQSQLHRPLHRKERLSFFSSSCCRGWEFLLDPPALELAAYLPLTTFTSGEIAYLLV